MLDGIEHGSGHRERVRLDEILQAVGGRSFAPVLLLSGLLALVLGGIPGVPTVVGILVVLTATQLLLQRETFWLPRWLLRRSLARKHLDKSLRIFRPPARWLDRWTRPRWTTLVRGVGRYAVVVLSLLIALALPPLEFVPFSTHFVGAALTAFGLALTTRDGVVELIAVVLTLLSIGLTIYAVVGGN